MLENSDYTESRVMHKCQFRGVTVPVTVQGGAEISSKMCNILGGGFGPITPGLHH